MRADTGRCAGRRGRVPGGSRMSPGSVRLFRARTLADVQHDGMARDQQVLSRSAVTCRRSSPDAVHEVRAGQAMRRSWRMRRKAAGACRKQPRPRSTRTQREVARRQGRGHGHIWSGSAPSSPRFVQSTGPRGTACRGCCPPAWTTTRPSSRSPCGAHRPLGSSRARRHRRPNL